MTQSPTGSRKCHKCISLAWQAPVGTPTCPKCSEPCCPECFPPDIATLQTDQQQCVRQRLISEGSPQKLGRPIESSFTQSDFDGMWPILIRCGVAGCHRNLQKLKTLEKINGHSSMHKLPFCSTQQKRLSQQLFRFVSVSIRICEKLPKLETLFFSTFPSLPLLFVIELYG